MFCEENCITKFSKLFLLRLTVGRLPELVEGRLAIGAALVKARSRHLVLFDSDARLQGRNEVHELNTTCDSVLFPEGA